MLAFQFRIAVGISAEIVYIENVDILPPLPNQETALRQPELGWRRLLPFMPPHRTPTSRLTTMPTR